MEPRRPKHKQQPPLDVARDELERALRRPESYNHHATTPTPSDDDVLFPMGNDHDDAIQVIHTHLSMVFLLPQRVYKLKKAVNFGFVDFSTLYQRFQACMAEVQLNKRLAPHVYVGVVPVSMHRETRRVTVRCDDFWTPEKNNDLGYWLHEEFGEIVEWAVHMVRLPDDRALVHDMEQGTLTQATLRQVAETLVTFHRDARRGPRIDAFGKEDVVRRNIDENFAQTTAHVDATVSRRVFDRVQELTYAQLQALAPEIQARVDHGYTCDCHGDLRLEHIYALDPPRATATATAAALLQSSSTSKAKPSVAKQLVIIDCIEFNEQFRFGDPLADVAFLCMDVWRMGRPDLARFLEDQYLLQADQDTPTNHALVRFYAAYRAVVRAKVSGFRVVDESLDVAHRERERQRARCYWLVALSLLAPPAERPCLLLVGGLPASGKSNLARMLAGDESRVFWLRADAIRKEIVGVNVNATATATAPTDGDDTGEGDTDGDGDGSFSASRGGGSFEEGLYAPSVTARTYDEILIRSVGHLRQGERVVVDATFRDPQLRARFMATAHREGALFALIVCECDREIIKGRMLARRKKQREQRELSDATWDVYEHMEAQWHLDDVQDLAELIVVNTEKEKELTLRRTNLCLRQLELL